ncbi:MAG: caspase family protein [Ilumatobacteraceae bacterium]
MQERGSWVADRTFVVAIGVNDAPLSGLPSLEFAHADAESVASEFCDSVRGVSSRANTQCLVTEETTTSAHVLQTLEAAARRCGPDDLLVIFFAGHGVVDQWSKALCLVAADTVIDDRGHVDPASALEVPSLISRVLTPCRGTTLLLLDTCFSGGFDVHDAEQRKLWRTTEMMFDTHLGPVERQYAIFVARIRSAARTHRSATVCSRTNRRRAHGRGRQQTGRGHSTQRVRAHRRGERAPAAGRHPQRGQEQNRDQPARPAAHHQIGATTSSERCAAAWSIRSLSNPLDAAGHLIAEMVAASRRGSRRACGGRPRRSHLEGHPRSRGSSVGATGTPAPDVTRTACIEAEQPRADHRSRPEWPAPSTRRPPEQRRWLP